MTPWQVLRASGAVQAALGSRYYHGQGGLVHYGTAAAAAAAAPDGSRSFCLSSEKVTLQQLNGRLASYLQQVQCLEQTNQKLEFLIQQELDRKCPRELRELDGHLRTVSLLQEQIRERLSDQAEMKLQLLHAELIVHDLSMRYEKEQERHGSLQVELSDLRLLGEELQVHRLPELQMLLDDQTQQLMELQAQHQQDMQRAAAQMSGGVTVEMQPAQALDLIQQLHDLRETNVTLHDRNQNDVWFDTQVSVLNSPEVTLDPLAGSEVVQAELQELRTTAGSLEQELTQLQTLNAVLEASGLQQNESIVQQLLVLQRTADGLCGDLDSVLQLTEQQVLDHQILMDVTTRLEAEIEDYRRLLDGLSLQGFSNLHPNPAANLTSVCVTSSPSLLRRRDLTVSRSVSVQGGDVRMMEVQAVSGGRMQTIQQTPVVAPPAETATAVQPVSKLFKNPPVTSTHASNLNRSFQKSESQTAGNPEVNGRESMTICTARNRATSRFWQGEVFESQNSSTVAAQISRGSDEASAAQASAQGVTRLLSDAPSLRSAEATLQENEQKKVTETQTSKTIRRTGPEIKQITHLITATTHHSVQTAAELKSSAQMNCSEGSTQAEDQDPAQAVDLQTPAEAQAQISAESNLICGSNLEEVEVQNTSHVVNKTETIISKQAATAAGLQEKETESSVQTVITKTDVSVEPETKQEPRFPAQTNITDPSEQTAAELKRETETVISVQVSTEGPTQAEDQDPAQAVDLQTAAEAQAQISELKLICGSNLEGQKMKDEKEVEVQNTSHVVSKTETIISKQAAGLQEKETESSVQTVITKTDVSVEPETKQEPRFPAQTNITDPSEQTAAELKRETETVISAQVSTEGPTQAEDQDPVQAVDLQTAAEAVKDAEEVTASASLIPQAEVSGEPTPMEDNSIERQETKEEKDVVEVESSSSVVNPDQITSPSDESRSEQINVTEEAHTSTTVASDSSHDNLKSETVQSATMLERTETTAAGLQEKETESSIQTVITKTDVSVEPETKQEPRFPAQTNITDPSEQTAAELKRETETVISAQVSTEGSTQAEDQDPAQAVDLQTAAEAVKDAEEVASFVPGSDISGSEEVQGKISGDDDNTEEREDKDVLEVKSSSHVVNLDQTAAPSDASSREQMEANEEAQTGSDITTASSDELTEGSIQPQSCDPAQVAFVSGSHVLNPEEAQDEVPCDLTLMNDNNTERQETKEGKEEEGTPSICRSDQIMQPSDAPGSEQVKEAANEHEASEAAAASSLCAENGDNLESKTAQSVTTSTPETRSIMSAAVQERTETLISENTTTAAGLQENKTETNFQTAITEPSVCAEAGAKKGVTQSVTRPTNTDPSEQTAAEVKKETETVIPAQTSTEGSTQAQNQDPVQVVSLSLQTDLKPATLAQTSASSGASKSVMKDADVKPRPESISSNGRSLGQTLMSLCYTGTKESPSQVASNAPATSQQETRRFSSRGSGEWLANGGSLGPKSHLNGSTSLLSNWREEGQSVAANPATNTQETGRFGSSRSAEWIVYSGSLGRKSSLRRAWSEENQSGSMNPSTSLPEIRRFGSGGRGSLKTIFSLVGDDDVQDANKEELPSVTLQKASSTPEALGRFGSGGSGEWRVYGGSTGKSSSAGSTDKASNPKISQPSKKRSSEPRLGSTGSTGSTGSGIRLSSGSVVTHTSSAGSGGGLSSSSSGGRLGGSSASQRISTSRKFASTGSGEWKPVYSSANARKSSVGSSGRSGGGGAISSQRVASSGGRMIVNMGSGGWLSSSTAGVSSPGSGSKLSSSGGSDRISILAGAKISSSSGSGRTNSTGGRVISSSDRPVRSTGSGAGGNKERISVCKMAALSISAAGRERNQGKQEQPQRPQKQQQAGASSPFLQRWLTAGVGIKGVHPDGLDDITSN